MRRRSEADAPSKGGERAVFGIVAMLASTALFPMSDMLAKSLTADLPALEVAWMRYAVFLVLLAPLAVRHRAAFTTSRPGLQVIRATAGALATAIAIVAFSLLAVADATAIGFVTPVIVTGLAALVLKEKVGWRRWLAAALGFGGILIMVQPGGAAFQPATLIPLLGSLFGAVSAIATRSVKDERIEATLMASAAVGFVMLSCAMPAVWHWPSPSQMMIGGAMGVLAAAATLAQVLAYRYASASLVAPFSYTQLIWAGGLGWLAFGTMPGAAMLLGCAVIALSGLMSAWRAKVPHPNLSASSKPLTLPARSSLVIGLTRA